MANIQNDINAINNAVYGQEVRGSIVNALTLMNQEVGAQQGADAARAQAEAARDAAMGYANAAASYFSVANHRNIYRGVSLGDEITSAQQDAIRTGSFDGIYIGDYWETLDGRAYVADMDYWLGMGTDKHHLIIICDGLLNSNYFVSSMRTTPDVGYGYRSSRIYSVLLSTPPAALCDVMCDYPIYIQTRYNDVDLQTGVPNGNTNGSCSVWAELLTETMVFGQRINSITNNGTNNFESVEPFHPQLTIFRLYPGFLIDLIRSLRETLTFGSITLRDVCSHSSFAGIDTNGNPKTIAANVSNQLTLPYFIIGIEEEST